MYQKSRILLISLSLLFIITGVNLFSLKIDNTSTNSRLIQYSMMEENQITSYYFDIKYDASIQTVSGKMKVNVPNGTNKRMEELYFHLFPNAFTNWKWEDVTKPEIEGSISIKDVSVNEVKVFPHQKETLMKINLPVSLKPSEVANIDMVFELKLPKDGLRLNHNDNTAYLAQWYPMLAVFDKDGWHLDPYTTTGDPFFSEIANFEVILQTPKGYKVISTAVDPEQSLDSSQTVHLSQKKVRDFAITITKEYENISSKSKEGINVNLFFLPEHQEVAGLLMGSAIEALEFFNEAFGRYAMEEIDIILANAGHGIAGMEYPGLITSNALIESRERVVPSYNVIAHELAHQWWYSTVGNNQVTEPWLDEGLTSFSEYLFMEQVFNRQDISILMKKIKKYTDDIAKSSNLNVLQSIYTYGDMYGPFIYGRPAAMLWELKEQYGLEVVKKILQTYYGRYQFKIATTENFIQIVNDVMEKDMTEFFNEWFLTKP